MKNLLFTTIVLLCFVFKSYAQQTPLNDSDSKGSAVSQYIISGTEGSRVLNWDMWVESYSPYIEDIYGGGQENMIKFSVGSVLSGEYELYFDNYNFPYGNDGPYHFSGSINLSGFTDAEIEAMELDTAFYFISGGDEQNPEYHGYGSIATLVI